MTKNYRVRIVIYDVDAGSHEEPVTFTDEPLFNGPGEIAEQAFRTQRYFLEELKKQV
jgi:hypothetical protein